MNFSKLHEHPLKKFPLPIVLGDLESPKKTSPIYWGLHCGLNDLLAYPKFSGYISRKFHVDFNDIPVGFKEVLMIFLGWHDMYFHVND